MLSFLKLGRFSEFLSKIDKAVYPMLGLPSYENYLEHFKKTHPGKEPLSRGEFFKSAQDEKYAPGRTKC